MSSSFNAPYGFRFRNSEHQIVKLGFLTQLYGKNESEDGEEERDIVTQDEIDAGCAERPSRNRNFPAIEDVTDTFEGNQSLGERPANASLTIILVSQSRILFIITQ